MGIFSRLTDIINSNLNALLDRAEEPEKLIRLIIQEMEDTLVEVRSTAARTIAEKKNVKRALERIDAAQAEWQRKAELAIAKNREDLAKGALVEKARLGASANAMAEEFAYLDEGLARSDEDVGKLEAKLIEAKAKQKTLRARHATIGARLKVRRRLHDARVEDAFTRFEQIEERLDTAEGEVEANDLGQRKTLADEIDDLESESAIEKELSDLKTRVAGGRGGASRVLD